jgi:hypothetical protein
MKIYTIDESCQIICIGYIIETNDGYEVYYYN